MTKHRPNVLVLMTDEERYPPPYEDEAVAEYRRTRLPTRQHLLDTSVGLHRHYVGATACIPSRATLFTGQYPTLHGVTDTDGLAKTADDPAMTWLDPDTVPTLGDWFRAAGYRTHYRGKWHISHADLVAPGSHVGLAVNDRDGDVVAEALDAYRRADRLDRFGFSGWIGREPHGPDPADTGYVRDPLFADQVVHLFGELAADPDPWLVVASLVNPHDIAFSGFGWQFLGFPDPPDHVPDVPEAPSQGDSLADRPAAQQAFVDLWPQLLYPQPTDGSYRRFYYWLHELVDVAMGRIVAGLEASGMADDTIVVFTSDHGDLLGAHGGLQQKWHNAYDEALRVPCWVRGPGVDVTQPGIQVPTSHLDLVPTLLGLCGIDVEAAGEAVSRRHVETHPLVGRDLSPLLGGTVAPEAVAGPVYFMTEDQISRGLRTANRFNGQPYEPVAQPAFVESLVAPLPGEDGTQLWKLNRYYAPDDEVPAEWELHNLSVDPEERTDRSRSTDPADQEALAQLRQLLAVERATKLLRPRHTNDR